MSIAIKLSKVVSYYMGLPHIKSNIPLNTWSQEILYQFEYVISLLPQSLWPLNVAKW